MQSPLFAILPLALAITACGGFKPASGTAEPAKPAPFGPTGIPPHLRAKPDDPGTPVKPGGNATAIAGYRSTPMEDILFTGDTPDANLPELASVLAAGAKTKIWEQSDTEARARAAREGKPVLIWFTSMKNSAMCKALSDELFVRSEFETWAAAKVVRLKIEFGRKIDDPNLSMGETRNREIDIERYVEKMKKRYKVLGYPTLVMLSPSGEVLGRYAGYRRGTADFVWGQLKHAESVASLAYADWRKNLEAKGYREWQDPKGRKIFARLIAYNHGDLALIDPDGNRFRTRETQLSDADQNWIAEQKKLRSMP